MLYRLLDSLHFKYLQRYNWIFKFVDYDKCCEQIVISSTDAVTQHHADKLGEYHLFGSSSKRSVYKMVGENYYLSWTDRYTTREKFVWVVITLSSWINKEFELFYICVRIIFHNIFMIFFVYNLVGVA